LLDLIDKGVIQQTIAVQFHVAKYTDGKIYKLGALEFKSAPGNE
jgi:hypothetical protein